MISANLRAIESLAVATVELCDRRGRRVRILRYATDEEEESSAKDPGHAKLNQSKKSLLTYRSKSFFANHVEGQMIAGSRSRIGADRVQCSPTKSFSNQSKISQISKVRQCSWEVWDRVGPRKIHSRIGAAEVRPWRRTIWEETKVEQ